MGRDPLFQQDEAANDRLAADRRVMAFASGIMWLKFATGLIAPALNRCDLDFLARGMAADKKGGLAAALSLVCFGVALAYAASRRLPSARSKRSAFITLVHAATKSFANFSFESAQA